MYKIIPFTTPSPAFVISYLYDCGPSKWGKIASYCDFNWNFSNNY